MTSSTVGSSSVVDADVNVSNEYKYTAPVASPNSFNAAGDPTAKVEPSSE